MTLPEALRDLAGRLAAADADLVRFAAATLERADAIAAGLQSIAGAVEQRRAEIDRLLGETDAR